MPRPGNSTAFQAADLDAGASRYNYQIAQLLRTGVVTQCQLLPAKALFMTVWRPSTRSAENSCGIRQG